MTTEAQRIAIAVACGWTDICDAGTANPKHFIGLYRSSGEFQSIPDYVNDLNAMHEAEELLDSPQSQEFPRQLEITRTHKDTVNFARFYLVHATASQRAEAFLKTIRKWTE